MTKQRVTVNLQYFAGEKTEKATPRKRQEAREKGQVAKSTELSSAFLLLFLFFCLWMIASWAGGQMLSMFRQGLSDYLLWQVTPDTVHTLFSQVTEESGTILLPILLAALVIGLAVHWMQTGFLFTGETLKPSLNKINPLSGAKRILSMRSIVELIKSILKIGLTSAVAYYVLAGGADQLIRLTGQPILQSVQVIGGLVLKLGLNVSGLMVVLAVLDFMYQKFEHEKQLRMSKQDIKDEYRKTEGDPFIKGKRRERQRQLAMGRMMQDIPKADVIITNPTHYAVAIAYQAESMKAPTVVAKGQDHVALKIRERARELNIVIMENKPLARALYAGAEIGEEIPEELFKAVAEILAYVYRLKGRTAGRRRG